MTFVNLEERKVVKYVETRSGDSSNFQYIKSLA